MKRSKAIVRNTHISTLDVDTELKGDLSFTGELHIKGRLDGNVISSMESHGQLILHTGSLVSGEITAPRIIISGMLTGNLFATEKLTLLSGAVVNGDVHYRSLEMQQGATVNGTLVPVDGL
ncbi:MAG: polymer-forming cytoskeletal protein [Thiotrichaceae bacterium]|nr:polymer-forming cytoskeletal protein [Thiotrichaceae bacterium]